MTTCWPDLRWAALLQSALGNTNAEAAAAPPQNFVLATTSEWTADSSSQRAISQERLVPGAVFGAMVTRLGCQLFRLC